MMPNLAFGSCSSGNNNKRKLFEEDGGSSRKPSYYYNKNASPEPTTEGDRMIAKDMLNLSLEERQKVYEQVHGVDEVLVETPALVEAGMELLQRELARPRKRKDRAVDKLAFLKASRLQDKALLLLFLRCEDFDGVKAGQRLMAYFDFLYEHFGLFGLLADRLTVEEHLNEQDIDMLRKGTFQPYPDMADRSGRPILLYPGHNSKYSYGDLIRAHTYITMSFLQDSIAAQTRGIVGIVWRVGKHGNGHVPQVTPAFVAAGANFFRAMPLKLSAAHFCYDNPRFQPILEFAKVVIGRKNRVRFRPHYGSLLECRYQLMSFGVDVSKFPLGHDGEVLLDPYHRYLDALQQQETLAAATCNSDNARIVPRENDVLLGRGKPFLQYSGNQRLSQMVDHHWQEYTALDRNEKTPFCRLWTKDLLHKQGIRFLKREGDEWHAVSEEECVQKVIASFRNKKVIQKYHAERFWQRRQDSDDDENDDDSGDYHNYQGQQFAAI